MYISTAECKCLRQTPAAILYGPAFVFLYFCHPVVLGQPLVLKVNVEINAFSL